VIDFAGNGGREAGFLAIWDSGLARFVRWGWQVIALGDAVRESSLRLLRNLLNSTGRTKMPDEPLSPTLNRKLMTNIVAAYVRRNQIGTDQLRVLISTVRQALATVGERCQTAGAH